MFDRHELDHVLQLQEKNYKLLRWVNRTLQQGGLDFSYIHQAMSASQAAQEWIQRHYDGIPLEARPVPSDIPRLAHLFASNLATSFTLVQRPGLRSVSADRCYCPLCRYWAPTIQLKPRPITRKARDQAVHLQRNYLQKLAEDLELPLLGSEIEALRTDPERVEDLAIATYATELIRRSQFASQGVGILVLWRAIAWDGTAPKKNFQLTVERVFQAEAALIEQMKEAYL